MKAEEIFIAGAWRAPVSGETYRPINPANEEPLAAVGNCERRMFLGASGTAEAATACPHGPRAHPTP